MTGPARISSYLFVPIAILVSMQSASAVTVEWALVEHPGNSCENQGQGCFGAVATPYRIAVHEVTNAQYSEFLNAKAASDPLELYDTSMAVGHGGILRSGSSGSFVYSTRAGREDMPVNFVTFYDALRFVNWLHNGQGDGDTETGAYTLLGASPTPSNGAATTRDPGATIFLPTEDEWYKAAYYNGSEATYYDYPTASDGQTTCSAETPTANHANCDDAVGGLTVRGSYPGSPGPYGTLDQGGNVFEWNEALSGGARGSRGGSFADFGGTDMLAASTRGFSRADLGSPVVGIRLASVPEAEAVPGLALGAALVLAVGLAAAAAATLAVPRRSQRPRST